MHVRINTEIKYDNLELSDLIIYYQNSSKITSIKQDITPDSSILNTQSGVFRTNCLDCLDRTNVVQIEIANMVLLEWLNILKSNEDCKLKIIFELANKEWSESADVLSQW